jgi:AraC-like DNA-binding protein
VNGLRVGSSLMVAAEPDVEARFVAEAGFESVDFFVRAQDLATQLRKRRRAAEFRYPRGLEILAVEGKQCRALHAWGRRLVDAASRHPGLFDQGSVSAMAAQAELFEMLLATLGTAAEYAPTRRDRTRQARSLIVRAAEDYALSRADRAVQVADLCEATGVSERTLGYAFNDVLGLTPISFLTRLRLHRVRQALLAATPATTTVSAEALKWGFWHFGEFSRAYKACFAELPSQTLRRSPG